MTRARVALVTMPWARTRSPSISCGLLKSVLEASGHDADVHYANVLFADRIGPARFRTLMELGGPRHHLLTEWAFTKSAFGRAAVDTTEFLRTWDDASEILARNGESPESIRLLHEETVPAFVESLVESIDWSVYDLVGFSSTFDQNVASIALAAALKRRHPDLLTVFGGANVDGDMGREYLRVIDCLDFVVRGDGEIAFPSLVSALATGGDATTIPGVLMRRGNEVVSGGDPVPLANLEIQPLPDYSEYFGLLDRLGRKRMLEGLRPRISFESSRGCWWGAKHHCTFCGLNALGMQYRAKSVGRVVDELHELAARYETLVFEATDNILDYASMAELCESLAQSPADFEFFYEVKANLTRAQVESLWQAGVQAIQPGIESLSTHVLQLMDKGSTKLINLRVLKWAVYYGINVHWSILTGFPGETAEDFSSQTELIPLLHHLRPPNYAGGIWLERFSPYFAQPDRGFTNIRAKDSYRMAYPVPGLDHDAIAYFFDFDVTGVGSEDDLAPLQAAVEEWQRVWAEPADAPILKYFTGPGWMRILDTRSGSARRTMLHGDEVRVLAAITDTFHSVPALERLLSEGPGKVPERRIVEILRELCEAGFVVEDGGRYFSIAMPVRRR